MKNLFITTTLFFSLACFSQSIWTVAGNGGSGYSGNGINALTAQAGMPDRVVADASGNFYFSDAFNNIIRKVDASGIITTIAGNGTAGYSGDGGAALNAQLNSPMGLALDNAGNLFIADYSNHRVRKVDVNGVITTVAGTGIAGFSGDGYNALTAQLNHPRDVEFDQNGVLYIADTDNNRIRKIVNGYSILTVAGNTSQGYSGDGMQAWSSSLSAPAGICFNSSNEMFIADAGNNRVRKVDQYNMIHTVCGDGIADFTGDNGLAVNARLYSPGDVCMNSAGELFIADKLNDRIRKIDAGGVITTYAGSGTSFSDSIPANQAQVYFPTGICMTTNDELLIAVYSIHRVRKVALLTAQQELMNSKNLTLFPVPATSLIHVTGLIPGSENVINIFDSKGSLVSTRNTRLGEIELEIDHLQSGIYFIEVNDRENHSRATFIKN